MEATDEESITDLEILPDGRIFIFGASRPILEILDAIQLSTDRRITERTGTLPVCCRANNEQLLPSVPVTIKVDTNDSQT